MDQLKNLNTLNIRMLRLQQTEELIGGEPLKLKKNKFL